MSVIFGMLRSAGHLVTKEALSQIAGATERYAPDGLAVYVDGPVGMGFQSYHTHERSRLDGEPRVDRAGNILTFDGRLDNYRDLAHQLSLGDKENADSAIVLAAFERWGERCFAQLIGDWALVLWDARQRTLYLCCDHAGTRTLYYSEVGDWILWSTYLESFFVEGPERRLDPTYAACYLAGHPAGDLTPYEGIRAVPAAHYLKFSGNRSTQHLHWSPLAQNQICYENSDDYREQFASLLAQSIERRTGPGAPILSELSGGMDSSSIVCFSDWLRKREHGERADLLDTVSFYDRSEPNWDEEPYFSEVEHQRGATGLHLYLPLLSEAIMPSPVPALWPGRDKATYENERRMLEDARPKEYRVILSGHGGDELLGGVPIPFPELADYIASGKIVRYARQCLAWCLATRRPFFHLSADIAAFLFCQYRSPTHRRTSLPPWMRTEWATYLRGQNRDELGSCERLRHLPSQIANERTWWKIVETLPHRSPACLTRYEYRYPYLDRDLVDFLLRLPREVLVEPGRRRSLMRKAMKGIVPDKVLERRRKANRSRSVLSALRVGASNIEALLHDSGAEQLGLVDPAILRKAVPRAIQAGDMNLMQSVTRFVLFELWFRQCGNKIPSSINEENYTQSLANADH